MIVLNAEKIRVTGRKAETLEWDTYSKHPGGRKLYSFETMRTLHPEKAHRDWPSAACCPRAASAAHMLGKLKVYRNAEHPHSAQQPKAITM